MPPEGRSSIGLTHSPLPLLVYVYQKPHIFTSVTSSDLHRNPLGVQSRPCPHYADAREFSVRWSHLSKVIWLMSNCDPDLLTLRQICHPPVSRRLN